VAVAAAIVGPAFVGAEDGAERQAGHQAAAAITTPVAVAPVATPAAAVVSATALMAAAARVGSAAVAQRFA
jgi:hypothetical protein